MPEIATHHLFELRSKASKVDPPRSAERSILDLSLRDVAVASDIHDPEELYTRRKNRRELIEITILSTFKVRVG